MVKIAGRLRRASSGGAEEIRTPDILLAKADALRAYASLLISLRSIATELQQKTLVYLSRVEWLIRVRGMSRMACHE